jgi:hypothetical protein
MAKCGRFATARRCPSLRFSSAIGRQRNVERLAHDMPVMLMTYDIIEWNSRDLRSEPLTKRRRQLWMRRSSRPPASSVRRRLSVRWVGFGRTGWSNLGRFGTRTVQLFELGFETIAASPRQVRNRHSLSSSAQVQKDKPAAEAETLDTLRAMLSSIPA